LELDGRTKPFRGIGRGRGTNVEEEGKGAELFGTEGADSSRRKKMDCTRQ
jgi:hypothetical protein